MNNTITECHCDALPIVHAWTGDCHPRTKTVIRVAHYMDNSIEAMLKPPSGDACY